MEDDDDAQLMTNMEFEALIAHELFSEYRKAGFTEKQALMLIGVLTALNQWLAEDEVSEDE
ncbi:hypothetical protein ACFQS3_02395 [Glycomyces mayteni]|uniref:Uncharacterized protein n=1 Tax=Glycomyces mayteni TaxID=543887 RepID=A0ABW2D198_9ACTN|nr:hypothetical protein GCM10025732_47770 [Glycomyces mayteni]